MNHKSLQSKVLLIGLICLFGISAIKAQLISNTDRLRDMDRMLKIQQQLKANGKSPVWEYLKKDCSGNEKQALDFLYAYMPLSDLADYTPQFFHANVKYALKAKTEMVWGNKIPEDVFLHFVLPLRINNENLDSFRIVMYQEIKDRIKGMSMKDAALEINHWCHEKVTYRGTDGRTSAPLSTVKKSFGRCGEESTFTVTALRTAGIPARQVYTPRWAHSDDNHAWVEVWVDGKWYFMGACEPDADLNMGWFNEPATRTMLVHTRAYGRYFGSEDVVEATDRFSELNLTSNYAPDKKVTIAVKDENGNPVDGAKVEFKLYNYAEFYPIAIQYTQNGKTDISTGLGDLLIWASFKGKFGYARLSVPSTQTLEITLNKTSLNKVDETYFMVPPKVGKTNQQVTEEQQNKNNARLIKEDSIRHAYMSTFKDSVWAIALAKELKLSQDTVKKAIAKSYGNWLAISEYLRKGTIISRKYVLALLGQLSDKDFSDAKSSVLLSQLASATQNYNQAKNIDDSLFITSILAPRMANENLSAWRAFLLGAFNPKFIQSTQKDISVLTIWILKNIKIDNLANVHSRSPLSPEGVYKLKAADKQSRDLFFVAACRSFGIAARINQATQEPEYFKQGKWLTIRFTAQIAEQSQKGRIHLINGDNLIEPQYYMHFTIGKLKDGTYTTLEFDEEKRLSAFPKEIELETGYYSIVTGNRQSDGSVLSSVSYFKVSSDSLTNVKVELVKQPDGLKSNAALNLKTLKYKEVNAEKTSTLSDSLKSNLIVLIIIDPDKEPSKHIMNDLGPYRDQFNKLKAQFIFVSSEMKATGLGILKTYSLPADYTTGLDVNNNILNSVSEEYGVGVKDKLPLVLFMDNTGNVYYFSSGYKIGVGEQLLRLYKQAEKELPCNTVKSCTAP
jgi:hypothetical protein